MPAPQPAAPRYICIHGHFYQPPRENPWSGVIERQESAAPYHDWNARIAAECYTPNARCRNFGRMSFNVGPTLMSWLELHEPRTYAAIVEADARGLERFGGHGPAIAQVYGHVIMPLADERDRRTQVRWGIADFRHRFGREPEGMWLAETAVDIDSLESLAAEGIRFTILSPQQAARVRPLGDGRLKWTNVFGGRIDPSRAYQCELPSGRSIALFFYDAPVSNAIAFDGLLKSGEKFAERLLGAFHDERTGPQLVHVATDGETYGHHTRHGERALLRAAKILKARGDVPLTTYGEFLERHPPQDQVKILEFTAWSCPHNLRRWCDDCSCRFEGSTRQTWRGPLRESLDWLHDRLAAIFERLAGPLLADPWAARDDFIEALLDPTRTDAVLLRYVVRSMSFGERASALKLLEMQRFALLMYTSCGWFFDDIAGLEAVQILRYAARAMELAEEITGETLETVFRERLALAPSNNPEYADGRGVWDRLVRAG